MMSYAELQGAANQVRKDISESSAGAAMLPAQARMNQVLSAGHQGSTGGLADSMASALVSSVRGGLGGMSRSQVSGGLVSVPGGLGSGSQASKGEPAKMFQSYYTGKAEDTRSGWRTDPADLEDVNLSTMAGMSASSRARNPMKFVNAWSKPQQLMDLRMSPASLLRNVAMRFKQNEWATNPMYIAISLFLVLFFLYNYVHPSTVAFRPEGMFYFHNHAYDKCVSHYTQCEKGMYKPEAIALTADLTGQYQAGRGGPLDACPEAYTTAIVADEDLPAVLTTIYMMRKYARAPRDYVVLVSQAVSEEVRQVLYQACVIVRQMPHRKNAFVEGGVEGDTLKFEMDKISLWMLDEYKKAVYIAYDMLMLRGIDKLWDYPTGNGQISAPTVAYNDPQHFGGYAYIFQPSAETYNAIAGEGEGETYNEMSKKVDTGPQKGEKMWGHDAQGFLNMYFSTSWLGNPSHRLPFGLFLPHTDLKGVPKLGYEALNTTAMGFLFADRSPTVKPWLQGLETFKKDPEMMRFTKLWWAQYYEMTDRAMPKSIDMYSLLELGEYSLYWKQMYGGKRRV
eukprot:gene5224-6351_t